MRPYRSLRALLVDVPPAHGRIIARAMEEAGWRLRIEHADGTEALVAALRRRGWGAVLYGGDGQDRALADTWVFDVQRRQWQERRPPASPHPRSCHAMAYLDKSGKILLVGGMAIAEYPKQEALSRQAWVYDAGDDRWTPLEVEVPKADWLSIESIPGTDEVIAVSASRYDHGRVTYRFRFSYHR